MSRGLRQSFVVRDAEELSGPDWGRIGRGQKHGGSVPGVRLFKG